MPHPSVVECLQATFLIANKQTYRVSEAFWLSGYEGQLNTSSQSFCICIWSY